MCLFVSLCVGPYLFFQAEDAIRDQPRSRGLGDVYKIAAECREVFRARMPDVWAALLESGAIEMPFGGRLDETAIVPRCGDADLFGLLSLIHI
uniref:Uncharacterized protein n=1 Tax=Ralstonia solanacearum TaxID=305 RepID=A0A0S4XKW9_RALSL|nr:protein of unknown function [Ralstonia solanacearum]